MRRRFSDADRQRFFVELDRSGDSAWQVARRLGLSPSSAYRWLEARKEAAPVFARMLRSVSESPMDLAVQVGVARILVSPSFDPELLRAVVHALSDVTDAVGRFEHRSVWGRRGHIARVDVPRAPPMVHHARHARPNELDRPLGAFSIPTA